MWVRSTLLSALALGLPALASAQTASTAPWEGRPAVVVFANGGGGSPLANLNDAGTADFKTGWTAGGGAGVQINRYVAVRAVFDYLRNKGDAGSIAYAGQRFNHYFYGGDIQLRYPTTSGFAPYLLAGAGAVTINNQDDPTFDSATKLAGKGGVGVEYALPGNGLGIYAQGTSYLYKFDRGGFDKTQADLLWTLGVSYRFGRAGGPQRQHLKRKVDMTTYIADPIVIGIGLLLGRIVLGLGMAAHGAQKLFGWFGGYGLAGTGGFFEALGFRPGRAFAAAAAGTEIAAGLLTALGLLGPIGPALMVPVMLVAAIAVHWKHGFFAMTNGIELPLLYAAGAVVLALAGPGQFSLDALLGLQWLWNHTIAEIALLLGVLGGVANLLARRRVEAQPLATGAEQR